MTEGDCEVTVKGLFLCFAVHELWLLLLLLLLKGRGVGRVREEGISSILAVFSPLWKVIDIPVQVLIEGSSCGSFGCGLHVNLFLQSRH